MNAPMKLLPEALALAMTPPHVARLRLTSREEWLAARGADVTASAVGALFGVHEYASAYALWMLKTQAIKDDFEETPPMRRGRHLEPVAVKLLAEERPTWALSMNDPARPLYYRETAARIGATPDCFAVDPARGFGIVQVKSVEPSIFRKKWRSPDAAGEIEPPLWIALQAAVEMALTGASWACVAALVVGHGADIHVVDIPQTPGLMDSVRDAVAEFWASVDAGKAPDPDYGRDAALLARLYPQDDGTTVDLSKDNRIGEILAERAALKLREADGSAAEKARKALDTEILAKLGTARAGRLADGRIVEAKTIIRNMKATEARTTSFRQVKVSGEAA